MLELKGKYGDAKVFTDNIDQETISQVIGLLNQPYAAESKIRIMPDCHAGSGCVIGTTMTLTDKVVPNLVGVDIGCFAGDTKVYTVDYGWTPIKTLVEKKEFVVDSYDEDQIAFVMSKAIARKTRENAELVKVHYHELHCLRKDVEHEVYCTPDHKFLVEKYERPICSAEPKSSEATETEWVEAKDLLPDMRLISEDYFVIVDSVEKTDRREDVYCLTVEDTHNFLIEGSVVVHNCGMYALQLEETDIDLSLLDAAINQYVPAGFNIHEHPIATSNVDKVLAPVNVDKAMCSLGTLGGGNHFIEVDRDTNGNLWLVIHTGSRHLGVEICNYYQELGYKALKASGSEEKIQEIVARLKAEGRPSEIESEIKKFWAQRPSIPKELSYVTGKIFDDYLHDMELAQEHAWINREVIAIQILQAMDLHVTDSFQTVHNYIDTKNRILRKGSISAQSGEKVLIPLNMRDDSLICIGQGNPDWNYSAPHGAGRILSRSKAKDAVSMDDFKDSMSGIYSTSVTESTIDESPFVYKPMDEIMENIKDTVEVVERITPIYNFKAH